MNNYYLYYKADDSVYAFDTRANRKSFRNENEKKGKPIIFEVERYEMDEVDQKSTSITLYLEDEEDYPLGYLTSFVAIHTEKGIVAEWRVYDNDRWVSHYAEHPSIDECVKDYLSNQKWNV